MKAILALEDGKRQFYKNLRKEISESLFSPNRSQSFESLVPLCRVLTNQIIVEQNSRRQN